MTASLLAPLLPRLQGSLNGNDAGRTSSDAGLIDLLLFNPPYVPTTIEEEEQAQRDAAIAGSWAGGNTGTRLLEQLIDDVDGLGRGAGVEVRRRAKRCEKRQMFRVYVC